MGVGALMTLLCGGCSAVALVVVAPATLTMVRGFATGRSGESEMYAQLFVAAFLVIGLLPTAIGWGLYQLGRRLYGPVDAAIAKSAMAANLCGRPLKSPLRRRYGKRLSWLQTQSSEEPGSWTAHSRTDC